MLTQKLPRIEKRKLVGDLTQSGSRSLFASNLSKSVDFEVVFGHLTPVAGLFAGYIDSVYDISALV